MDTKVIHKERQTYTKYDNEHYMLYQKEEKAIFVQNENEPDERTEHPGWAYTGPMADGGTLIKATDVTGENRRAKFIAGLIATRYSIDDQLAVLANGRDTEGHQSEYADFERFRAECKAEVDALLTR